MILRHDPKETTFFICLLSKIRMLDPRRIQSNLIRHPNRIQNNIVNNNSMTNHDGTNGFGIIEKGAFSFEGES